MYKLNGQTFRTLGEVYEYVKQHPELLDLAMQIPDFKAVWNVGQARDNYDSGKIGANDLLGTIGNNTLGGRLSMTPETEKWLDNQIARENEAANNAFQEHMRDTSVTSTGEQLQSLGLSPSSVIQVGGASSGVTSQGAGVNTHSAAALHQQEKINRFNQQMGLAKNLISTAGSMASSGIYGAALGAVKHSAQALASTAAHSGYAAINATKSKPMSKAEQDAVWKWFEDNPA